MTKLKTLRYDLSLGSERRARAGLQSPQVGFDSLHSCLASLRGGLRLATGIENNKLHREIRSLVWGATHHAPGLFTGGCRDADVTPANDGD